MAANEVVKWHLSPKSKLIPHLVTFVIISEISCRPIIDEGILKRNSEWLEEMKADLENLNELPSSKFKYEPLEEAYSDDETSIEEKGIKEDYVIPEKMENVVDSVAKEKNGSLLSPLYFDGQFRPTDDLIASNSSTGQNFWTLCQLPIFIVIFAVVCVLIVTLIVLVWLKSQMLESGHKKTSKSTEVAQRILYPGQLSPEERWIVHTVISLNVPNRNKASIIVQPQDSSTLLEIVDNIVVQPREETPTPAIAGTADSTPAPTPEKRPEAVRIKAKGLLERRGSNVSLTIDLPLATCDAPTHVITPTRECSAEEFLLSAGNALCRSQLKSCLKDTVSLHREFWDIPLNHPEEVSAPSGCSGKNRYRTILPNERSRVHLEDSEEDHYINANYIRGYDGEERAYIATQGPLGNTIVDLYSMIWSHRCPIIVMMTHLVEKAKPKCEPYFPLGLHESASFGDFDISVEELIPRQGYVLRHLLIQHKGETRRVMHYWFDSWPDHKTPLNAQAIIAMATEIEKVRTNLKNAKSPNNNGSESLGAGPVVVHCSAGIGRTGCFIAISLAICQLLEENKVDLLGIVCQLRYDRGGMIQTAEQYEFVHRAVAMFEATLPDASASSQD